MGAAILLGSIAAGEAGLAGLFLITASLVLLSVGLVAAAGAQALERRARAVRPYVGPSPFLVFAASLVVTILLLILVGRPAVALGFDLESSGGTLISISITALVYVGLVRLLVVGMGALSWSEMGLRPLQLSRVGADILYGASFAVPTVFVTGLLGAVLVQTLGVSPEPVLPQPHDQATLLLNLVSAAVIAPVGEELFFRGFATTAWIRSFGATRAIVQGAIFFAFIHILTVTGTGFGDAAAKAFIVFVVRLPVSVGLGLVFAQRRSIYASIGMHGAFNGILVLVTGIALAGLKG